MAKRGKDKDKRGFWIIVGIIILVIVLVIGLRLYLASIALEPTPAGPLLSPSPASVKDSDGRAVSPNYAAAFTPGCTNLFEDGTCGKKIGVLGDTCNVDILYGRRPWLVYEGYATKRSFIFFESTCAPGACCTWRREDRISCQDICLKVCYNELGRPTGPYDPCAKAVGYCTTDAKVCEDESGKFVDSAHCECEGWKRKSPSSSPSPSP